MTMPFHLVAKWREFAAIPEVHACLVAAMPLRDRELITNEDLTPVRGELQRLHQRLIEDARRAWTVWQSLADTSVVRFFTQPFVSYESITDLPRSDLMRLMNLTEATLLHIAESYPLPAEIDSISLNPITADMAIFVALNGKRHDLVELARWVRVSNRFCLPDTMLMMRPSEVNRFKALCTAHDISTVFLPRLTPEQERLCNSHDITQTHLLALQTKRLTNEQLQTIVYLKESHSLTTEQAVAMLQGLTYIQAEAIRQFYAHGLRREHFQSLGIANDQFSDHHLAVIDIYVEQGIAMDRIITAMHGQDVGDVQAHYSEGYLERHENMSRGGWFW